MKNYMKLDHENRKIVMDRTFSKISVFVGSEEYNLLQQCRRDYPTYTVTRNGEGLPMKRYEGYEYNHLAYLVKNRIGDPFLVRAKYKPENDKGPLHLNQHKGQEFPRACFH